MRRSPAQLSLYPAGFRRAVFRGLFAGGLLLSGGVSHALAQEPVADSSVVVMEEVVVSSARAVSITGGTSAVQIEPDSLHVASAPTLDQVLRELPFVGVRENSRGQAEITVRGSESRQVAVLVDGVPLTLGWDHRTDPSVIPLTGARSITLVRGLHSVLHGPNVLGGVVDVNLARGDGIAAGQSDVEFRAGVDQFGGRALNVVGGSSLPMTTGELRVRAGAGLRRRRGFALPATLEVRGTGSPELRTNSDLQHHDGFVSTRYRSDAGAWLGLTASGYRARRGVPPELHVQSPRLWRYPEETRLLTVLSGGTATHSTPLGKGDLEASLGVDLGSLRIQRFADWSFDRVTGSEAGEDRTLTLRLLGDHSLGSAATLTGALTYADIRHDERLDAGASERYRQRLWSTALEITSTLPGDSRLSGGLVLDGADTPETGDKPALGSLWAGGGRLGISSLALDRRVRLHAAVSRRARFPSLRELYSGSLGRFVPNPGLEPEKLLGVETGATYYRHGLELQAVGFHHRLSDAIVRTAAGDGRFRRENRDQIRSTGLELLAGWRRDALSLSADLMLQHIRVLDPRAGARRPEHQPAFRTGVNATVPLPLKLRGVLDARYTGSQICVHPDRESDVVLPGSHRIDAILSRSWSFHRGTRLHSLRVLTALDNVTDSTAFDQCGLPQPGRTLRFGIQIR